MSKRNVLVIDLEKCVGCKGCSISCKNEHDVPPGENYSWVYQEGPTGVYPEVRMYYLPRTCMHCSEPACVDVCPTRAAFVNEDGVVMVDEDLCFGCQYCVWACPYGARFLHPTKRIVQKCNLCVHLTSRGEDPNCVANCATKARLFGDVNDPESDVAKLLTANKSRIFKIREDLGTQPNVYYLKARKVNLK